MVVSGISAAKADPQAVNIRMVNIRAFLRYGFMISSPTAIIGVMDITLRNNEVSGSPDS